MKSVLKRFKGLKNKKGNIHCVVTAISLFGTMASCVLSFMCVFVRKKIILQQPIFAELTKCAEFVESLMADLVATSSRGH